MATRALGSVLATDTEAKVVIPDGSKFPPNLLGLRPGDGGALVVVCNVAQPSPFPTVTVGQTVTLTTPTGNVVMTRTATGWDVVGTGVFEAGTTLKITRDS